MFGPRIRAGVGRLRLGGWPIIQTAVAASVAWFLAITVLGHQQPFFAAVAAVISLGTTIGQRTRRAIETVFGVALGIVIADLLLSAIGTGTVQMAIVVVLAMGTVVFLGGEVLLANQAAISAILVATLQPPSSVGFSPDRAIDALVGGAVALIINYVFPINPEQRVGRSARPIFEELIAVLEEAAHALSEGNVSGLESALLRARRMDDRVKSFKEELAANYETARYAPARRRALGYLEVYMVAANHIDLAVLNVRGLARALLDVARSGSPVLEKLPEAVLDLSRAVRELCAYFESNTRPEDVRQLALKAAEKATMLLKEHGDLATSEAVGQIRFIAIDLLRTTGMDRASALRELEEAAGRASELG
jgi:uncharacterized membrane protein YgaE (UPF0421/DUF939 family)